MKHNRWHTAAYKHLSIKETDDCMMDGSRSLTALHYANMTKSANIPSRF